MTATSVREGLEQSGQRRLIAPALGFLLLAGVFGVSHGQFPLYYFVQNQHFFHGLKLAGVGLLRNDWLASTADVWPVFSLMIDFTYRFVGERAFYFYYILLLGVYVYSLLGIVAVIYPVGSSRPKFVAFLALVTAVHSPLFGYLSTRVLGWNAGPVLVEGVASQRILYDMLQPSAFGAFLLLSIYLFLRGRPLLAILSSSVAAVFHPVYILIGAGVNAAYLIVMARRGEDRGAIARLAMCAIALLLPASVYMVVAFFPTSREVWTQALSVLVHFRIPRHALVSRWLDGLVCVRMAIVLVGIYLARRTALATVMLLMFVTAVGLTIVQVVWENGLLALLFPWRFSVLLVPLATSLIIAHVVSGAIDRLERRLPWSGGLVVAASVLVLAVLVGAGALETVRRFHSRVGLGADPMPGFIGVQTYALGVESSAVMNFVRETREPGQVYLVPLDSRYFRLYTGAPVYVDYWYIPYNDAAVMEWYRRVQIAEAFYVAKGEARCGRLDQLAGGEGITHVVLQGKDTGLCPHWRLVFDSDAYRLYAREVRLGH